MDASTSQGIRDGLTLILFSGGNILKTIYGDVFNTTTIPGFNDIIHTYHGSSGVRVTFSEPGQFPNPYLIGIDVPSGIAATIGIIAKRKKHLQAPFSNCTNDNIEVNVLTEKVREQLGDAAPVAGVGIIETSYSLIDCR